MSTSVVTKPKADKSLANDQRGDRRVTMRDVAEKARVQIACVSVVINGAKSNSLVSPAARERILAAADELGYRRNGGMASIVTGKFGCVALLLSTDTSFSMLPTQLWHGIHNELARKNTHLSLFRLPDEKLTDQKHLPKILREWMADGMLIDYTHNIPEELRTLIAEYALPAIWINSKQEYDCVRPDDLSAGIAATEYLLNLGHRKIAYVDLYRFKDDVLNHYSATDRYQGYLQAMQAAGAEPQSLFGKDIPLQDHALYIERLLQNPSERPTALITYNGAESVLWAAAHLRLEVPRDLSVINLNSGLVQFAGIQVTAFQVPEYNVGRRASLMIQEKIAFPNQRLETQILPFTFFEGDSTARPSP